MVDYSKWDHIETFLGLCYQFYVTISSKPITEPPFPYICDQIQSVIRKKVESRDFYDMNNKNLRQVREKLKDLSPTGDSGKELKDKLQKLQKKQKELKKEEEELAKKEKKAPKNVDTLSQAGFTRTIINAPKKNQEDNLSEDEKAEKSQAFMEKYKKEIEHFGMLSDYNDSQEYMRENPHLACEDTANYLALWCINLEVQEKHSLMERVAHQTIIMQYMLELAKSLDTTPRATINSFFVKMKRAKTEFKEYMEAFDDELRSFLERVKERAQARIEKAIKEAEQVS
ncbi:PREDICTED: hsp90 co-chaperone Cdc37-like [Acropora digitifera]|uniref:hsp90 co-chaperone Cdc37-like n=1 Tax=Acropora digitifera TaxID=70779 RepID=UPI00077A6DEA|nr:PREDICTED: hsp90 co-chaperone Cdc37-like [Acropora digitifera]